MPNRTLKSLSLIITVFLAGCVLGMTQELTKGRSDGDLDLFVSNWNGPNGPCRNKGDGTLAQIDNDRFLDLFPTLFIVDGVGNDAPASSGGGAMVAHFGLGDAANADAMRIEWPSGTV
jgi:hypothetical protein